MITPCEDKLTLCPFQSFRDAEYQNFNEGYNTAIKAFALILAKMYMRKGSVSHDFISDLYTKVNVEALLTCEPLEKLPESHDKDFLILN